MQKIGLMLDMPEGKLPGFYAQIVKGLAQRVTLFDRDKELLVLNHSQDRDAVLELLQHYHIASEEMQLLLLPAKSELYSTFTDYGFTSRAERNYLYEHLVSVFYIIESTTPLSEPKNAFLQMQEHLIVSFKRDDVTFYAVDRQFNELIERIAKAYRCSVIFTIE
jgi:hypothetical protein